MQNAVCVSNTNDNSSKCQYVHITKPGRKYNELYRQ